MGPGTLNFHRDEMAQLIAEGVAEWLKGAVLKTAHFLGPRRSFWFHSVQMAPAIGAGRRRKVRNGPNAFTPFANLSECRHRRLARRFVAVRRRAFLALPKKRASTSKARPPAPPRSS